MAPPSSGNSLDDSAILVDGVPTLAIGSITSERRLVGFELRLRLTLEVHHPLDQTRFTVGVPINRFDKPRQVTHCTVELLLRFDGIRVSAEEALVALSLVLQLALLALEPLVHPLL